LIFSRQNIKSITTYETALQSEKGAYIITKPAGKPDVIMVANGSEVSTLVDAKPLLEEKGLKVQIVSAPSEGLFFDQSQSYREEVIPPNIPVFALTAGIPSTMLRLAGTTGKIVGLEHFGYSAPAAVLDEKFGFTAQNVFEQVMSMIKK